MAPQNVFQLKQPGALPHRCTAQKQLRLSAGMADLILPEYLLYIQFPVKLFLVHKPDTKRTNVPVRFAQTDNIYRLYNWFHSHPLLFVIIAHLFVFVQRQIKVEKSGRICYTTKRKVIV